MKGMLLKPDVWKGKQKALATYGMAVTRRLGGLQEINKEPDKWHFVTDVVRNVPPFHIGDCLFECQGSEVVPDGKQILVKPRYQVGETVYIKEAHYRWGYWQRTGEFTKTGEEEWEFISTSIEIHFEDNPPDNVLSRATTLEGTNGWFKRSPLFLPARFARHFLTITANGAERLQEITKEDCLLEGIKPDNVYENEKLPTNLRGVILQYAVIWDSINPNNPFLSNPFVFRYEFKIGRESEFKSMTLIEE